MSSTSSKSLNPLRIGISVLLLIALIMTFWVYNKRHPSHSALPHLTLQSMNGNKIAFNQLRGKPVVINLWATWCPPCRAELPMLLQASKRNPHIQFYFVEQGNNFQNVAAFDKSKNLPSASVVLDENTKLSKFFGTIGYPTTIFYNADGNITEIHRGQLNSHDLDHYLKAIRATS